MANASYTLTMLIRSKGARTVKLDVNKVTGGVTKQASRARSLPVYGLRGGSRLQAAMTMLGDVLSVWRVLEDVAGSSRGDRPCGWGGCHDHVSVRPS